MKNKILLKIALIILMITVIATNITVCLADDANFEFDNFDNKTADASLTTPVRDAVGAILSVVRIVGTGVSIFVLAFIGMKYMIAAPGDRADFKKGAMQYVVGAVIVFGASNILGMLVPVIRQIVG